MGKILMARAHFGEAGMAHDIDASYLIPAEFAGKEDLISNEMVRDWFHTYHPDDGIFYFSFWEEMESDYLT